MGESGSAPCPMAGFGYWGVVLPTKLSKLLLLPTHTLIETRIKS
jgi:hypothetical protein